MKHLTLLLACSLALCLSASAQFTPQQYPFPYNPDSNQDGMVSMTDFLEILGLFGQEYPDSFHSDSTRAVLNLGPMGAISCVQQAEAAGTNWRVLTSEDIYEFAPLLVDGEPYDGTQKFHFWSKALNYMNEGGFYTNSCCSSSCDCVSNSDSTAAYVFYSDEIASDSQINFYSKHLCFLVTEVRPTILYTAPSYAWQVEDLLNDGWRPLGNANGFWKEAE